MLGKETNYVLWPQGGGAGQIVSIPQHIYTILFRFHCLQ